jgi:hypothetical protein
MIDDDDLTQLRAQNLFKDIVQLINDADIHPEIVFSILVKLVTMHGIQHFDKDEYMMRIEYVWQFEKFFQPDSNEVH